MTSRTVSRSRPAAAICAEVSASDAVDVLHRLPLLEEIRAIDAHRLAHQLQEVHDAERVGRSRARRARGDTRGRCRRARPRPRPRAAASSCAWSARLYAGTGAERVAHVADARLRRGPRPSSPGMAPRIFSTPSVTPATPGCSCSATRLSTRRTKCGREPIQAVGDVRHDVLERERGRRRRHHDLAELDVARRAPRQHARRARGGEAGHGVAADAPGRLHVARPELEDAAAVRRTAEDLVARADAVEDVHAEQRDVRRLHHVAAEVEHDVGRGTRSSACAERVTRATRSAGSCRRESTFTPCDIVLNAFCPAARRSALRLPPGSASRGSSRA